MQKVSVIIPTMPGREDRVKKLVSTIPKECEVIVMCDNGLLAHKRNQGARQAKGDYLLFIDDDNFLKHGAIENMLSTFDESIGVMGMTACYQDRKVFIADGGSDRNYLTGFTKGIRTNRKFYDYTLPNGELCTPVSCLPFYGVDEVANAFMIPHHVFMETGGFDEENFPIDLDEADLCKRITDMGYRIVMNPKAICYHDSLTYSHIPNFRREKSAYFLSRNIILFQRKHLTTLSYFMFCFVFLPIRLCFYTASLIWYKNFQMIPYMLKGTWHGIIGHYENEFERKIVQKRMAKEK